MAQFVEAFGCEQQSVGHHAPRKATVEYFTSHDGEVVAEQGFAAGDDDENIVRIALAGNAVENAQKVLARHVLHPCQLLAVAAAMAAMHVAAQRTLPEQLSERMAAVDVLLKVVGKFEPNLVAYVQTLCVHSLSLFLQIYVKTSTCHHFFLKK